MERWLPGFGVVHHVGRRSGRAYRTPVNLFPSDGGYLIALTYGEHTEWVRNVLAAGGCVVETRGHSVACTTPMSPGSTPRTPASFQDGTSPGGGGTG